MLALVGTAALVLVTSGGAVWGSSVSLIPDDEVPSVVSAADGQAVELGLRFTVEEPVDALAVQFYVGPDNVGAHPATLWSGRGRRLAHVDVPDDGATGLRTARLDSPVRLQPGRDYVVSYTASHGAYAVDPGYFAKPVSNGPLRAAADAGVYTYRPGRFPTRSHESSSYAVDVVVGPPGGEPSSDPATPTDTSTGTPTATPSEAPTPTDTAPPPADDTASATPTPTDGATATDSAAPGGSFPTAETAGVPPGWEPARTVDGRYVVDTPGAVVEDLRVNGTIEVAADDVTLRRVEVVGGSIGNWPDTGSCTTGLRLEQVSVVAAPGQDTSQLGAAISTGGYTADHVKIDGLPEGFRVGGQPQGCGPVTIADSYVRIVAPESCAGLDWHGDGLQGWEGDRLTLRDTTIVFQDRQDCMGTAPFFYPDQGNASVDIDGLLLQGGGYSFRLGTPGSVRNLAVVQDSWWFGPLDVKCDLLDAWDAHLVRLDDRGQPVPVADLPCDGR